MTRRWLTVGVLLAGAAAAQAQATAGIAELTARRQAITQAATRLAARSDIKALDLDRESLAAFTAVVFTQPAAGARTVSDAAAAARIAALRRDQDVSTELGAVWARLQQRHTALAAAAPAARPPLADAIEAGYLVARAYAELARTQTVTVGGRAIPDGGHARAQALAETALALAPELPEVHVALGDIAVENEQPDAGEAHYRRALALGPPSSAGHTKLAAALRYQGRTAEATAAVRDAIRLDPTSARAFGELGLIFRSQRNLPEAIAAYREAVRLDPSLIEAHNGLGQALAQSGQLADAITEFRAITRIDPESTIGYYNLAYALADADLDVESAAALREVIRIYPDHYNARFNLGELFRLEGKYDDSATQFREYLRLAPETAQNRRNITRARGYIRQFEDPDAPIVPDGMMRK